MVSERTITTGTILYSTYVIHEVLGEGGFGITYRGIRRETGEIVAIKEYFPSRIASRNHDSGDVLVSSHAFSEYTKGKDRFIKEASILKKYQYLQGIVRVLDCFETNNTAYLVMEYIDGITLKEYSSIHGGMDYIELLEMLSPVLKSLIALHRHGVIHRDISPDNLMIGLDNSMYLIDFGAAKTMEYGETTTVLLKAGYAPPEQYLRDGDLGEWTDVYALCATIYTSLSGKVPTDAIARLQGKELLLLSQYGVKLEEWQQAAIMKGLSMRSAERFRNVEQLYDALTIEPTDEDIKTIVGSEEAFVKQSLQEIDNEEKSIIMQDSKWPTRIRRENVIWFVVLSIVVICTGGFWVNSKRSQQQNESFNLQSDAYKVMSTEQSKTYEQSAKESAELQEKVYSMPDVVGLTEDVAIKKITSIDKKILVNVTRIYSGDVAMGIVIEQNVMPDTRYNEGAIKEINLIVSKGSEPIPQSTTQASTTKKEMNNTKKDYFDIESEEDEMKEFLFE